MLGGVAALLLVAVLAAGPAAAQESVPLFLVNENTTVSGVSFRFRSTHTFDDGRLAAQIATEGPSFFDRVKSVAPLSFFLSVAPHPFIPIQLQRDVARLRQYYRQNGFLQPEISYAGGTVLDTAQNEIDVVFAIEEGPPLIIQDVSFYGPDSTSYAVRQFEGPRRGAWIELRDQNDFRIGERYNQFNRQRIEDAVLRGLKNQGYAFARVGSEVRVDSSANTVDLQYFVDAGPRARVSQIEVRGNESVGREVVLRELPFKEGDWFSADALAAGQRELFGLQLFRVALAQVPPTPGQVRRQARDTLTAERQFPLDTQPRDSTVVVRYNVREASLRYLTTEGGYSRALGVTGQGTWTHRNFLGDARELSLSLVANTGFAGRNRSDRLAPERLFRTSASVRQPYLFTTKLSAVASVFAQVGSNPQLDPSDRFLGTNTGEAGLSGTAIYEIFPYRTATLSYELSRSLQFLTNAPGTLGRITTPSTSEADAFNKSILTASATLGHADNYVNPSRGFLVRPFVGTGLDVPIRSGIEYLKAGTQFTGYLPIAEGTSLAGRVQGGRVWPYGESAQVLSERSEDFATYESRFDPVYYYAGGANDVRGWAERLTGSKVARRVVYGSSPQDDDYFYEAVGGRSKLSFSMEMRMPFPGLGESWGTAAFLDAGQVWDAEPPLPQEEELVPEQFSFANFRYGTGAGLRYRTPVGFLRLDLAYKVNPDFEDLRGPEEVYEYNECRASYLGGCTVPPARFWNRLRLHLSIGQSF